MQGGVVAMILLCTALKDIFDIGEDDMMLSSVQHSPAFRQVWVHTSVVHEVLNENCQTA